MILGNDAIVAARPWTTSQLSHACGAAGFDIVVPPSWGDELVAHASLEQLATCAEPAVVVCSCDRVRALVAHASDLRRISIAAPAVLAARYLRLVHGESLLITYVGDCPSATDPAIDARFSPVGFLASLQRQGISVASHPAEAGDTEAARWRRYRSTPGGLPARRFLARPPVDRVVREVDVTTMRAALVAGRSKVVLDFTQAAGCACGADRAVIEECEPARSFVPVVVAPAGLDSTAEPSPLRSRPTLRARPDSEVDASGVSSDESRLAETPPATAAFGETAATRTTSPRPARSASAPAVPPSAPPALGSLPVRAGPAAPRAAVRTVPTHQRSRRPAVMLVVLPVLVLSVATALGVAAYSAAAGRRAARDLSNGAGRIESPGRAPGEPAQLDSLASGTSTPAQPAATSAPDSLGVSADSVSVATVPGGSATLPAPADSVRADSTVADSVARERAAQRARRRRAPEVVPGWLPQGQRQFTPIDTSAARKPDSSARPVKPDTTPPA